MTVAHEDTLMDEHVDTHTSLVALHAWDWSGGCEARRALLRAVGELTPPALADRNRSADTLALRPDEPSDLLARRDGRNPDPACWLVEAANGER